MQLASLNKSIKSCIFTIQNNNFYAYEQQLWKRTEEQDWKKFLGMKF